MSVSTREQRFEELLTTSMKRLSAIARSYARGDEGKDLLQEILLQIWRSLDRFEGRSTPDSWAYRVALNTAIAWRRKELVRPVLATGSAEPEERAAGASPGDELAILDEFVGSLGPTERALFVLYLEDLSYRQISEVTGLSESHVGVKIHRIKKTFIERYVK